MYKNARKVRMYMNGARPWRDVWQVSDSLSSPHYRYVQWQDSDPPSSQQLVCVKMYSHVNK